jgi:hypothetical protein
MDTCEAKLVLDTFTRRYMLDGNGVLFMHGVSLPRYGDQGSIFVNALCVM